MTEQEAIKRLEEFGLHHAIEDLPHSAFTVKAFKMGIKALEEIQQYRAIGTVEECRAAVERQKKKKSTAYDAEKVVEQLEEKILEIKDQLMYTHDEDMAVRLRCKMHGLDEALEIVKGGGANE